MPLNQTLKVVGWTSSYRSIQKYLNYLKKDQKKGSSEENTNDALFSIEILVQATGKNPDEIIETLKSKKVSRDYYYHAGRDFLRKSGYEADIKFWEACFTLFQLENGV